MKVIKLDIGKGKTTKAIKLAAKGHYHIVCVNNKECDRVSKQAYEMELDIPSPISFLKFTNGLFDPSKVRGFVIDNADILIDQWLTEKLKDRDLIGVTLSGDVFDDE